MKFSILFCLMFQIIFWYNTRHIKNNLQIVKNPIGETAIKAIAWGDNQFYFRIKGMQLQNAGDSFGRFTALKYYDYNKLSQWFYLIDTLDSRSDFITNLAGYYYSQTQKKEDVIYIINYLVNHAEKDIKNKYWWMAQASYLAMSILRNNELALEISYKLKNLPENAPSWIKYLPPIIMNKMEDKHKAYLLMETIMQNSTIMSENEKNFVNFFIKNRLEMEDKTLSKNEK